MGIDVEQVKACMREVLLERQSVDSDTHREHHAFLDECIPLLRDSLAYRAKRMAQIERRDKWWSDTTAKARDTFIGALVLGLLGALGWIGKLVWQAFLHGPQS